MISKVLTSIKKPNILSNGQFNNGRSTAAHTAAGAGEAALY
jgi:hypothetical protein